MTVRVGGEERDVFCYVCAGPNIPRGAFLHLFVRDAYCDGCGWRITRGYSTGEDLPDDDETGTSWL